MTIDMIVCSTTCQNTFYRLTILKSILILKERKLTLSRPDLVIIKRSASPPEIYLCELTVAYESATSGANQRKEDRYASLVTDIESRGFSCTNINFEIGSRGFVNNTNKLASYQGNKSAS